MTVLDVVKLKEEFVKQLVELPESGMGYQLVTVKLFDGRVLKNRVVFNSENLKLEEGEELKTEEIAEITLEEKK